MQFKQISIGLTLTFVSGAFAAEPASLPQVEVIAEKLQFLPVPSNSSLEQSDLARLHTGTDDTAQMLDSQPGINVHRAGGVSSLPVIHGMADDRVRVKVDGMDLISACANHMNPPLSYIDPVNVADIKVMAGITPVSAGGDSIAGTIRVDSNGAAFAQAGQGTVTGGQVGVFYRGNNSARGMNLSATLATEQLSVRYTGSTAKAKNYKAANAFKLGAATIGSIRNSVVAGDEVGSTGYRTENHALAFGARKENHLLELKLGLQNIPYQSFPNQRMDMTGNDSSQVNLRYVGQFDWGELEARAYKEHTKHHMQFLGDKTFWYGIGLNVAGMPMETDGKNSGFLIKGDVILSERDILRVGAEHQAYRLNDWWNPVTGAAMMSPLVFQNINNGQRDRSGVFGEWEAGWSRQWVSQIGLRWESVKMNVGNVQGYNVAMYGAAATAFNALPHQQTDDNVDFTALARYTPDEHKTFQFGFAQKTRSPSLYERFAWSNSNTMVMNMNNWYGDGNGYVGNLNLKPEVASTLSGSASWYEGGTNGWEIKAAPYYTHVQNYIDAVTCATVGKVCAARPDGFLNLSLANQTARLYGADVSLRIPVGNAQTYGNFTATGVLNYVNGKNLTSGDNLYNIMPLNMKLALEQRTGNWTNTLEAKLVDSKTHVQATRKELVTAGYGLINLYSSYEWQQLRFDVGVENLFNKFYAAPLGGAYVGQGSTMGTAIPYGVSVPGMGRSINIGATVKF